jgi:predicted O-linked N-acetylglucosamine transferase (SPINDLY family)
LIIAKFVTLVQDHLATYHQIDIALDTFPYNGATTTCEALWMGVPVVTLVGDRHASRMGLSLLATVGLRELIAYTKAEYVNIAVKLANDLESLQSLRAGLRERMQSSPLMDASIFTGHLEAIYRQLPAKASSPAGTGGTAGLEALAGRGTYNDSETYHL